MLFSATADEKHFTEGSIWNEESADHSSDDYEEFDAPEAVLNSSTRISGRLDPDHQNCKSQMRFHFLLVHNMVT